MRKTLSAAVLAGAAALTFGTATATAQPAPNVVGMEEHAAYAVLDARAVPFTVTNRSGNISGQCTVTGQRDKGYRTEVEWEYDHSNNEYDRTEIRVWRGIGLTVVCR
ncbi:hypothetical protein [Rhodococcus chondri]|uniref:Ig-like domain-containing protein n=1 Tax=Rhodococcus chondri TaxID=3065941 RepID=A0ABU7JYT7_9NOCA|nr:hypothetical protein [Rhodococcus sp. CC-R104]MEE2035166.1 hypothetical protein [Rhodococcus sp. CC-R104]